MKIAVILGTRPEIIKMAPVIKVLDHLGADYYILHTGQHYSYQLDRVFFEQLTLPPAKYNLEVGSGSHAEEIAKILTGAEKVLQKDRPDIILVEGDTNSVLAGALVASKLHIKVGHIEAGLRSYDRQMPEEINRILTDHCADYLFAPTQKNKDILIGEGIHENKIIVTGNTIVDVIYQYSRSAKDVGHSNRKPPPDPGKYFLVTLHRQENVDHPSRFRSILDGLEKIAAEFHLPVIYPIHPRSRKMMKQFELKPQNIELLDPVDYFGFIQLESNARIILTDSGGVQEEACILKVPCITLRDTTERPETIEIGANILAGASSEKILACTRSMINRSVKWTNPYGDGKAGEKIVKIIIGVEHG
jgi:UDP-N-acetylglucosamine 2-epimerase (non-hydrolysing)